MDKFQTYDKAGQIKVVEQLQKIFSAHTLNIEQHFEDKCSIDIYVTATTKTGKERYYAIEAKDRDYTHSSYDVWFLEQHKYTTLMSEAGKYSPLYINTFKDNWMVVWDLSKIDWSNVETSTRTLSKTTVIDKGKQQKMVYMLPVNQAVYNDRFIV